MIDLAKYRASPNEAARTADLLGLVPKNRTSVLDIGARDGHFSRLLTQYFERVTALDLERPAFSYPGVETVEGDVTRLDFPAESFDCVFCAEVLEHIGPLEQACREIVRVARHEVVIGVPYRQDIRLNRMTCSSCGKISPPWGHVNTFDEQRLHSLFEGLAVRRVSFVGRSKGVTNALSTLLMDAAGNPLGAYENQEEPCSHCGKRLARPSGERPLWSKLCSGVAWRLTVAQQFLTPAHGAWIHVVYAKGAVGATGPESGRIGKPAT